MAETLILNAAVAVATVYENTARGSGKLFWNVVTDTKDRFTAFSRDIVAHLIDGRTPTVIEGRDGGPDSLAYNISPPLNTMLFFEARATGKVLVPTPEGATEPPSIAVPRPAQMPPPNPPGTLPLPGPAMQYVGTPPGAFQKQPYRPYGGGQRAGGSGWKPEDKRPGLVTMNEAYAKDIVTAIIGNSDDLKIMDHDKVLAWATEQTVKLAKVLLDYTLAELKAMGFKLEPEK
jgi:hypothetical protein